MNVLSLIDSFNPERMGGAARVFNEVNISLLGKGHTVHAICRSEVKELKDGVLYSTYPDIEGGQFKKIKYYANSIKKLYHEYISDNNPDLIIIHSSSAVFGLYDDFKKMNTPIIYYFHSPWHMEYEILANKKFCGIQCPIVSMFSLNTEKT